MNATEKLNKEISELKAKIAELQKENEALIAKQNKERKPGVIQHIVTALLNAGKAGITKSEVHAQLIKAFPDRDPMSMAATVNVQLPGRLQKDRKFKIESFEGPKGETRYRKAN